jgi:hypothetical protein
MNRRKSIIFIFYFLLLAFGLFAQDTWVKNYQPFGEDVSYFVEDIRVCPDEGYAVIGSIWSDELTSNQGFMMKTDSDGNLEWANIDMVDFITGPEPSGFIVLADGSFITIGNNFWGGGRYLLKRYPDGVIEWVVQLDNDYGTEAIELTIDGNMVTTGGSMDGSISLQKFDLNGNLIWRETYLPEGFEYGAGYSVAQTIDGGYAITGIVEGPNNWDIIVLKTDECGDSLWTWSYDGYGFNDRGNCIIEDSNQNIYISGAIYQQNRAMYTFIAKLDNYGDSLWVNVIPDMADCYSILQINNESSFTGYSWSGSSTNKTRLFKFNEEGYIIWNEQLPHWPAVGDRCFQELVNGDFICAGKAQWGDNITITKCDSMGQVTAIDENIVLPDEIDFRCYPNPFNPEITISYTISKPTDIEINVFNVKGQLVDVILQEQKIGGFHSITWNASNYTSGVYFIQLIQNDKLKCIKKVSLIK